MSPWTVPNPTESKTESRIQLDSEQTKEHKQAK